MDKNTRTNASRFVVVMNADADTTPSTPSPSTNFDWVEVATLAANVAIVAGAAYATYKVVASLDTIAKNTAAAGDDTGTN